MAVLGCSHYTYAEVTPTQPLPDGISAPVNAREALDGVPQIVVPDNPKTAVTHPCGYDPDLHLTYQEMAEHDGFAVLPARPRKPKDKAKVDNAVLIAERGL